MTIKQIAEIANRVDESTIRRWADKASGKMPDISGKMHKARETSKPADFTLSETIAIIRAGGKNTLADLLEQNAREKEGAGLPKAKSINSGAYVRELINASDKGLITRQQFQEALGVTVERIEVRPAEKARTPLGLPASREAQEAAASLLDGITPKNARGLYGHAMKVAEDEIARKTQDKLNGKLNFGGQS